MVLRTTKSPTFFPSHFHLADRQTERKRSTNCYQPNETKRKTQANPLGRVVGYRYKIFCTPFSPSSETTTYHHTTICSFTNNRYNDATTIAPKPIQTDTKTFKKCPPATVPRDRTPPRSKSSRRSSPSNSSTTSARRASSSSPP